MSLRSVREQALAEAEHSGERLPWAEHGCGPLEEAEKAKRRKDEQREQAA